MKHTYEDLVKLPIEVQMHLINAAGEKIVETRKKGLEQVNFTSSLDKERFMVIAVVYDRLQTIFRVCNGWADNLGFQATIKGSISVEEAKEEVTKVYEPIINQDVKNIYLRFVPYIFTDDEIAKIIEEANKEEANKEEANKEVAEDEDKQPSEMDIIGMIIKDIFLRV